MDKLVVAALVLAIFLAAFRAVRAHMRIHPGRRHWMVAAAIATLTGLVAIYTRIWALKPPFSESPSGLFVILGRLAAVVPMALAALATLVAAAITRPARSAEP